MSGVPLHFERTGKELLHATDVFAVESRLKSWFSLSSAAILLVASLVGAGMAPWWPLQLTLSILASLMLVRVFIHFHDFMHGAILRGSRVAHLGLSLFGILILTPPRSWRQSHNFHHSHVGRIDGSSTGSFPILTTDMWRNASKSQRLIYRLSRHPMTLALAYLTVFLYSTSLLAFLSNPRRHWDSALAIVLHVAMIVGLWTFAGPAVLIYSFMLPLLIAFVLGAYLFYVQHNFVGMKILSPETWDYFRAALESSSYLKLGPVMQHFTGNIGFHHVHHLNPLIPFYRLPEAMASIPELQHPTITRLRWRDVISSLRLKLWDPAQQRMIGFREFDAAMAG